MQDINSPKGRTLLFITRRYKLKFQAFYTVITVTLKKFVRKENFVNFVNRSRLRN